MTPPPLLPTFRTARTDSRYTDGPRAGRLIARKTGKVTSRWQQYVLDVGLERVDGPGSPFAYSTVDVIVGRRCGKTISLMGVPLFRGMAGPVQLDTGAVIPFVAAHTAQNLIKARQRFMKDLVEPLQNSMSPAVWTAGHNLRSAIGDTSLTFDPATTGKDWRLKRASQIGVFAPTISAVRGDGLLHLGFDEILVFTARRGAELMAAARPTLATLRGHGQIWRASNVTMMNDRTTWLYEIRERGRANIAADLRRGSAYFEFTIPEDADVTDERVWFDHYPALTDGLIRPDELRDDLAELGIGHFGAEYLGRWPGEIAIRLWSAITEADFVAARSTEPFPDDAPAVLGVEIDPFGRSSSIAAATPDVVEIIDHRPASDWVLDRVRDLAGRVAFVVVDDYGPGHDLAQRLADIPEITAKLRPLRGPDVTSACYTFEAGLREQSVRWIASDFHERLRDAAAAAERTPGRAWQFERRVPISQSPLMAAVLARYAAAHERSAPESEIF
jgi:hypothetical protein